MSNIRLKNKEKIQTKSDLKDYSLIAEILGILEEKGLSRDWLIAELKRHHIKSTTPFSS